MASKLLVRAAAGMLLAICLLPPAVQAGPFGLTAIPGIHCPTFHYCQPRPPCLCKTIVCSKPVCHPCTLEHYGYYPTCWRPWMEVLDYSHCPVPSPAQFMPNYHAQIAQPSTEEEMPMPSPMRNRYGEPR